MNFTEKEQAMILLLMTMNVRRRMILIQHVIDETSKVAASILKDIQKVEGTYNEH